MGKIIRIAEKGFVIKSRTYLDDFEQIIQNAGTKVQWNGEKGGVVYGDWEEYEKVVDDIDSKTVRVRAYISQIPVFDSQGKVKKDENGADMWEDTLWVTGYDKDGNITKNDIFNLNEYGMVELPADNPNIMDGQYTVDDYVVYKYHKRNDETPGGKKEQDQWGTPENVAKFINMAASFKEEYDDLLSFGDLSTETGGSPRYWSTTYKKYKPHASHFLGSQADIRYPKKGGGQTNNIIYSDLERTQWVLDKAESIGMNIRIIGTSASKELNNYTKKLRDHNNHIHIGSK